MKSSQIKLVDLKVQYQSIKKGIDAAINGVIRKSDFILGTEVSNFENAFRDYLGAGYVIGVSSGTDALHLALLALGVKAGDEVITTPFTFIATAEAICMCGAKPVFVDIDHQSYNINSSLIEEKITNKTKGIIPVHLYGQPADMDPIIHLARKNGLFVLEDCAQSHGALYKGKKVGTIGDAGIFSFFPAKNLGCYGDGGAVVTNNQEVADKIKLLRNHGRSKKYLHEVVGFGARLDTLQAAILMVKLPHLDRWNEQRRQVALSYQKLFRGTSVLVPNDFEWAKHVYHLYAIKIKNRDSMKEKLRQEGIETGIHYPIPLHLQPAFRGLDYREGDFPEAEALAKETLSLPIYPEITDEQIYMVVQSINKFLQL